MQAKMYGQTFSSSDRLFYQKHQFFYGTRQISTVFLLFLLYNLLYIYCGTIPSQKYSFIISGLSIDKYLIKY